MKTEFSLPNESNHLLIADTLVIPEIIELAYTYEKDPNIDELFRNSNFAHLIEQSPKIVNIDGVQLLEQIQKKQLLRSSSVLFSYGSDTSQDEIINHLQNLLTVHVGDNLVFFRFYSSLFWIKNAKHISEQDKVSILGPCHSLSWFNDEGEYQKLSLPQSVIPETPPHPYRFTSSCFLEQM
ncbi:DUF4123 domain-containing protein [Vibrio sp. LaRot3]|uniref:DUF4123 domain-containing protein n=1 Tax=Vibrio sp. LaRot3 TaxID=2998829 RepID=UPI0022CE30B4|nr:DUF4123 domain-containing protein [Vibrio sp. LaRot3]MDA0149893.1 DUF4123 domain-containing protein [Vibrio sp. LaRot3]